ncbi:MAG: hypothetical protein INH41_08900 [Myxococcaceae bacterium]|jgi:hypothetical protein|nr:hypothetical protein [Myxococcaceae bacterium]MCA3012502.1 hypothetical protein [Myxococcaceae bacterium]
MQACPDCGVLNDVTRSVCRGCGATSTTRGYEAMVRPDWAPPPEPPRRRSPYNWGVGLVVLVVVVGVCQLKPPRRYPSEVLVERFGAGEKAGSADPCLSRSTCVVMYVTPWCGACQVHVGTTLPRLRAKWGASPDRPGLKVVVGNSDDGKLDELARRVGDPVFVDRNDRLLRALAVRRFPSFYVVDQRQRITHEGDDAVEWLERHE